MRWQGFRKVRGQVCKRVTRRMLELELPGFDAYRRYLEAKPEEWALLDRLCRVTISRFWRDRGVWEYLREEVLPKLAEGVSATSAPPTLPALTPAAPTLRTWSVGCASGEEPYTLSILWHLALAERFSGIRLEIIATDSGPEMLARAREGRYPMGALKELPEDWRRLAFEEDTQAHAVTLRTRFREAVEFLEQDVRREAPGGPFHLVLCRNLVFTYFEEGLQAQMLQRILERMTPGGVLVLGGHESLPPGTWPLERTHPSHPVFAVRR